MMTKIRVGVVGTNFISDWMVEGAGRDERFVAAAVCSRREETGWEFARKHAIPRVFTSLDEMVADEGIDAVYIASPNYAHASQAITCMNAGKHVLCEKPMASNAAEARLMIEAARRNDVVLMEAMIPTLSPNFQVIADNLHRVGRIRRYFASYCQYSSRYDALKRGQVANAFKPELSNGAVMDIGVYCLYPMVTLFGRPDSVMASTMLLPTGADGQGTVIGRYDGFDAVIMYSKIADSMLPTEIQGEAGTLTIDRINNPRRVTFKPHDKSLPVEDLTADAPESEYYYEMREFIDLIQSGRRESRFNTHTNSLSTLEVIDEIRRQGGITYPADKV